MYIYHNYVQEYTDRCFPCGKSQRRMCVNVGTHPPSSDELSPFLEGGCYYAFIHG